MSDGDAQKIPTPEDLDQAAKLDERALEKWFGIKADQDVMLRVSRVQMDHLFLALRNLAFAQGDGLAALQLLSNGGTQEASAAFVRALQRHHLALSQLTIWTNAVMSRAEVDG